MAHSIVFPHPPPPPLLPLSGPTDYFNLLVPFIFFTLKDYYTLMFFHRLM